MTLRDPGPGRARRGARGGLQADGWLLYDFQGVNPVLGQVLGIGGMGSRRLFVYLPRSGEPVAVAHRIELQSVAGFPGRILALFALGGAARRPSERRGGEAGRDGSGTRTMRCRTSTGCRAAWCSCSRSSAATVVPSGGAGDPVRLRLECRRPGRSRGGGRGAQAGGDAGAGARRGGGRAAASPRVPCSRKSSMRSHAGGLDFDHPPIVGFGPNARQSAL